MLTNKLKILCTISIILIIMLTLCINQETQPIEEQKIIEKCNSPIIINGYTSVNESNITSIIIKTSNITTIKFILEWKDYSIGSGEQVFTELDQFEINITPPGNASFSYKKEIEENKENRTGYIIIRYKINELPKKRSKSLYKGTGKWLIQISCLNATGYNMSCNCPSAVRLKDSGNAWRLITSVNYYEEV